jgi:hypothetical protein
MTSPRLTPKIVTNDALLGAAIDAEVQDDATDKEHRERIVELQAELREHLDDDGWNVFLRLDAEVGARISDLSVTLAVWAFVEGQRDAGRSQGGGR